jgi:hypothetical protein
MESAEHLARAFALKKHGIQVLLWENKTDLIRALLVLKAALADFPDSPVLLPIEQTDLQRFSIDLYEQAEQCSNASRRFLLIPQASTEPVGAWLNGWRRRLADPPGTVIVIRRSDYVALCRRAPDLMSFAQADVHESTGLLPLIDRATLERWPSQLPDAWYERLNFLPGEMPAKGESADWRKQLEPRAS